MRPQSLARPPSSLANIFLDHPRILIYCLHVCTLAGLHWKQRFLHHSKAHIKLTVSRAIRKSEHGQISRDPTSQRWYILVSVRRFLEKQSPIPGLGIHENPQTHGRKPVFLTLQPTAPQDVLTTACNVRPGSSSSTWTQRKAVRTRPSLDRTLPPGATSPTTINTELSKTIWQTSGWISLVFRCLTP